MEAITKKFFEVLATRLRNENDLSDITWTMIQVSPFFKEKWLNFFFPTIRIEDIFSIEREVWDKKSKENRVDFHITTFNEVNYIIEVKIGDRDQHFGKYDEAFDVTKDRFGYITNYPYKEEGYVVKQWRDFYKELMSSIYSITDTNERVLVEGYSCYLKNVCCIMEVNNLIDLEKMSSLYDLTMAFKIVVNNSNEAYQSELYKEIQDDAAKIFAFKVKYTADKLANEWYFPYIGIWYSLPAGPRICAGFWKDKGWGEGIVKLIDEKKSKWEEVLTHCTNGPHFDESGCFFYMSEETIHQFNTAKKVEEQIDILWKYLDEVLMFPVHLSEK